MPFQSEKQRKYLWANEPEIAREWTDKYGSRVKKDMGGIMDAWGKHATASEAMKLMNEIESDIDGTIEEILLSNSEAVEYNQVLFHIKPS